MKKPLVGRGQGEPSRRRRVDSLGYSRSCLIAMDNTTEYGQAKTQERSRMADYTVVKISDVPDQAENLGHDPETYEIRFLRNELGCEHCGVSFARYRKGFEPPGHTHNRQEEIYLLVSGRAQALVGDGDVVDLEPWTALRVPPETPRALRAVGDDDAIFVKIGAPNTGPGDGRAAPEGFAWPD
jgi:mannose-6-phosphate isomerase-like protein (cupin superfamily)